MPYLEIPLWSNSTETRNKGTLGEKNIGKRPDAGGQPIDTAWHKAENSVATRDIDLSEECQMEGGAPVLTRSN